jgi:glycosyltransferase involved in cell wall biosynthesis
LKKSEDFKKVIPSKIFELSSMKKPILLGVEGEAKKIIEKYNAGLCFEPENEKDFVEKLKLMSEDKKLYEKLKNNTQDLAKDFDRKKLAEKMFAIIEKIVEEKNEF